MNWKKEILKKSDKKYSPAKNQRTFTPEREEDQNLSRNEDKTGEDSESRNETTNVTSEHQQNRRIPAENRVQRNKQEATVKYSTKKSRIFSALKQGPETISNVSEKVVAESSLIETSVPNFIPVPVISHTQNENPHLLIDSNTRSVFKDVGKDTEKESSSFKIPDHDLADSGPSHFNCNICNESFDYKYLLDQHYPLHLAENSVQCKTSYQKSSTKISLLTHSLAKKCESRDKSFQCKICDENFSTEGRLRYHRLTHKETKARECDVCHKLFSTKQRFDTHYRIHTGKNPYECDKCKKKFNNIGTFWTHSQICGTSPEKWKHICEVCGKIFPLKYYLKRHYVTHTGEKPFQCEKCRKCFSRQSNLCNHRKICKL